MSLYTYMRHKLMWFENFFYMFYLNKTEGP